MRFVLAAAAVCAASTLAATAAAAPADVPACAQITTVTGNHRDRHQNFGGLWLYATTTGSGVCPGVTFLWALYDHNGGGWAWHKTSPKVQPHKGGTGQVRAYEGWRYQYVSGWLCAVALDTQSKRVLSEWGYADPSDPLHSECDGFYLPPPSG